MSSHSFSISSSVPLVIFATLVGTSSSFAAADYQRVNPACVPCAKVNRLIEKINADPQSEEKEDDAIKIGKIISGISLNGLSVRDKRNVIYVSIKAAEEVMEIDFDHETVVGLIDLRKQAPNEFDFVFWRFSRNTQEGLVARMEQLKKEKIRPTAKIPVVKVVEP